MCNANDTRPKRRCRNSYWKLFKYINPETLAHTAKQTLPYSDMNYICIYIKVFKYNFENKYI